MPILSAQVRSYLYKIPVVTHRIFAGDGLLRDTDGHHFLYEVKLSTAHTGPLRVQGLDRDADVLIVVHLDAYNCRMTGVIYDMPSRNHFSTTLGEFYSRPVLFSISWAARSVIAVNTVPPVHPRQ